MYLRMRHLPWLLVDYGAHSACGRQSLASEQVTLKTWAAQMEMAPGSACLDAGLNLLGCYRIHIMCGC